MVGGAAGVALPGAGSGDAEELGDLGPGVVLVAGVGDCSGESVFGLGEEAGEEVESGAGVAEPWQSAQGAEEVASPVASPDRVSRFTTLPGSAATCSTWRRSRA